MICVFGDSQKKATVQESDAKTFFKSDFKEIFVRLEHPIPFYHIMATFLYCKFSPSIHTNSTLNHDLPSLTSVA